MRSPLTKEPRVGATEDVLTRVWIVVRARHRLVIGPSRRRGNASLVLPPGWIGPSCRAEVALRLLRMVRAGRARPGGRRPHDADAPQAGRRAVRGVTGRGGARGGGHGHPVEGGRGRRPPPRLRQRHHHTHRLPVRPPLHGPRGRRAASRHCSRADPGREVSRGYHEGFEGLFMGTPRAPGLQEHRARECPRGDTLHTHTADRLTMWDTGGPLPLLEVVRALERRAIRGGRRSPGVHRRQRQASLEGPPALRRE
jgi:hypothetical protein